MKMVKCAICKISYPDNDLIHETVHGDICLKCKVTKNRESETIIKEVGIMCEKCGFKFDNLSDDYSDNCYAFIICRHDMNQIKWRLQELKRALANKQRYEEIADHPDWVWQMLRDSIKYEELYELDESGHVRRKTISNTTK